MLSFFYNKLYFFYLSVAGFLFAAYAFNPFSMDDFYLHTEMGKWIVTHKEIPYIAVGSWYGEEANLPWIAHEWLSQVLFYEFFSFVGNNINIIHGVCLILCVLFVSNIIRLNKNEMEKHYYSSYIYLAIITVSCYGFFVYRPQIFSFFLFFTEIYCLNKFKTTLNHKFLYPIPLLSILWANFHGGSSALVYVIPILFVIFNYIPLTQLRLAHKFCSNPLSFHKIKQLLIVIVLAFLGLFFNPYGYKMVLYPYTNMMDENMLAYILEWVPLNITMPEHLILVFPVLFFAWFTLFQTKEKIDIIDFMFLLTFTVMTFKSGRFIMYFTIYSSFCMWKYFNSSSSPVWKTEKERFSHNVRITNLLVVGLVFLSFYKNSIGLFWVNDDLVERHKSIIAATQQENPKRIWNRLLGNELEVSGIKPFIDGRADAFTGEPFVVGNRHLDHSSLDPEKMINKYSFDYVVLYQSDPMMIHIIHSPDRFKLIYQEEPSSFNKQFQKEALSLYKIIH